MQAPVPGDVTDAHRAVAVDLPAQLGLARRLELDEQAGLQAVHVGVEGEGQVPLGLGRADRGRGEGSAVRGGDLDAALEHRAHHGGAAEAVAGGVFLALRELGPAEVGGGAAPLDGAHLLVFVLEGAELHAARVGGAAARPGVELGVGEGGGGR